ncbi:MAG TPA: Gldg family protein [Candidatus Acidoferrales bacterium]|nr:Gldg family protein [Candidatus Acidoferrales bacterium]
MKKLTRELFLQMLLYLAVIVLVNVVASGWFIRLDLTKGRINTLSPSTENLLKTLKDRLIVKVYFNSDLPSPYSNNRRALVDILQELRSFSGGKLEYEINDPTTDADVSKATSEGVPQVQIQVVNNDKLEVKRAFMGLVLEYRAQKQIIPVIEDLSDFEYDIASRIDRMINPGKKTIAMAQGNGEPSFVDIQKAQQALSSRYNVLPVDFKRPVPDSVSVLIMIQPATTFSDSQLYNLDQFMMKRGRAAFLMSMVNATMQSQFATDLNLDASRAFSSYGFEIKKNLVRDAQCALVSVMQREAGLTFQTDIPHPYIPRVNNLAKSFVVTQNLHEVVLPFTSEVDTTSAHNLHLGVIPFAVSSQQSGTQADFYNLDPSAQFTRAMFSEHYLLLGAAISGKIKTAIPDSDKDASPSRKTEGNERIIVMGNGNFVRDMFLSNPENLSIFLNIVDYLVDDVGLISIRSKSFLPGPLKPVSDSYRVITKDLIIGLPSVLILAFGLIYWQRTTNRRKAYRASLSNREEPRSEKVD